VKPRQDTIKTKIQFYVLAAH